MAIYMKYGDGTIKGEVTAEGFTDWIELDSCSYSISRPSFVQSGSGQNKRHVDACTVSDIQCSRSADKASPLLMNQACGGKAVPVEIDFTKTDENKLITYAKIKLENVMITSWSMGGGGGGQSESFSLNFTKITLGITEFDEQGVKKETHKGIYDVSLAKVG